MKQLKVSDKKWYNSHLTTGLLASILLGHENLYGYYLENYCNSIGYIYVANGIYEVGFNILDSLDLLQDKSIDKKILNYEFKNANFVIQIGNKREIDNYIKQMINKNYYIIAFMDEYYISDREVTGKKHFVHEALIYGYEKQCYNVIAFSKKGEYKKQVWNIQEVTSGILNGVKYWQGRPAWVFNKYLNIFSIKYNGKYTENIDQIIKKIVEYLSAKEIENNYSNAIYKFYGIESDKAFQKMIDYYIEDFNNYSSVSKLFYYNKFSLFQAIHNYVAHKKGLNEKIKKLAKNFELKSKYEHHVLFASEKIRLFYLKEMGEKNEIHILNSLLKMKKNFEKIRSIEQEILTEVVYQVKNVIN